MSDFHENHNWVCVSGSLVVVLFGHVHCAILFYAGFCIAPLYGVLCKCTLADGEGVAGRCIECDRMHSAPQSAKNALYPQVQCTAFSAQHRNRQKRRNAQCTLCTSPQSGKNTPHPTRQCMSQHCTTSGQSGKTLLFGCSITRREPLQCRAFTASQNCTAHHWPTYINIFILDICCQHLENICQ